MLSPALRSGEVCSTSLKAQYARKLFGVLLHGRFVYSLHLLLYSVNYLYHVGPMDIYLILGL